jgi:hypothetical protein
MRPARPRNLNSGADPIFAAGVGQEELVIFDWQIEITNRKSIITNHQFFPFQKSSQQPAYAGRSPPPIP